MSRSARSQRSLTLHYVCPLLFVANWLLLLVGCESPAMAENRQKQAAARLAIDRHFNDPEARRQMSLRARQHQPAIQAIWDKATDEAHPMTAQRLTKAVLPIYPEPHRRSMTQGGVWIVFVIGADGIPTLVDHLPDESSLNDTLFVEAARKAVAQWRFAPATLNGQPTPVISSVPVIFHIQ